MFEIGSAGEGDYDNIAIAGMSEAFSRSRGRIRLARTGPFVPPLCMTLSDLIATTAMLDRLKSNHFRSWSVLPVIKYQIVRSSWVGDGYPPKTSGDPEDFILHSPHDEGCAEQMSELWEIVPPVKGFAKSIGDRSDASVELWEARVTGGDLFRIELPGGHLTACSEGFRTWVESMDDVRKWLTFTPIQMTSLPKPQSDRNEPDIVDEFLNRIYDHGGNADKDS